MPSFTFAVLTCVSSEDQATEEHDSLDHQLRSARAYGDKWGGIFTREYRAEGFSRSGQFDLTPALRQCRAFGELAADAKQHAFDVVIVESLDRLGDLGMMWFNFFASLGAPYIQIASVQQRIMIDDPATYHPREDDSVPSAIAEALKVNKYRTNKIFRAFAVGNARRAKDGHYATNLPYGYIKVDKNTVVINPDVAPLIQELARMYLSGKTMGEVARYANASGIPSRRGLQWSDDVIAAMFQNPFYAGKTFYKRWKRDQGGSRPRKELPELYDGKHEPLWSFETYQQLVAEYHRRYKSRLGRKDHNFTGILKCSVCGKTLHINYSTKRREYKYWYCPDGHIRMSTKDANQRVADELVKLLKDSRLSPSVEEYQRDMTETSIAVVDKQIARLDAAYKFGSHTPEEYGKERQQLLKRREELRDEARQTAEARRQYNELQQVELTLWDIIDHIHEWIAENDPMEVKYSLSKYVTISVTPDGEIRLVKVKPSI